MKLIVENTTVEQPTLTVRWCLTPEELASLRQPIEEKSIIRIFFIVDYANEYGSKKRQIFYSPYDRILDYLPLYHAGEVNIFPVIITGSWRSPDDSCYSDQIKAVIDSLMYVDSSSLADSSKIKDSIIRSKERNGDWQVITGEQLTVNVPAGIFAKEPSKFEKFWVNLWFKDKPQDQCEFRRRRMLAYSIQLVIVPCWLIIDTLIRCWLAFMQTTAGFSNVAWGDVMHPFGATIDDVFNSGDYQEKSNYQERQIKYCWLGFSLFASAITVILLLWDMPDMLLKDILSFSSLADFFLVLCIMPLIIPLVRLAMFVAKWTIVPVGAFLLSMLGNLLFPRDEETIRAREEKKEEEKRRVKEERFFDALEILSCELNPLPKLSALPPKHRTIYLRFLETKKRVCRPFMQ